MAIKKIHIVKTGENVAYIASINQISVDDIVSSNPSIFTQDRINKSNTAIIEGDLVQGGLLIYPGEQLAIPSSEIDKLAEKQAIKADNSDDLTILIDGQKLPLPHNFKFSEYFDTCSDSFQLTYPLSSNDRLYKVRINDFKGKGLPKINIYIGEEPALTGEIEKIGNSIDRSSTTQSLGGRTSTRLLEKSEIMSSVQAEFLNLKLDEIAKIVARPHSIKIKIDDGVDIGDAFDKVTRKDNETPFNLISRLARERRLTVSNTPEGDCLIRKAKQIKPVARFSIGSDFLDFLGIEKLDLEFDTTKLYGNYIAKTQTDDNDNVEETVKSNYIVEQSSKRYTFKDSALKDMKKLAAWEEQKSVIEFYGNSIPFPSWIIPGLNRRWKAGDAISLIVPEIDITEEIKMLIRQVDFILDTSGKRTANLVFIPIESYL